MVVLVVVVIWSFIWSCFGRFWSCFGRDFSLFHLDFMVLNFFSKIFDFFDHKRTRTGIKMTVIVIKKSYFFDKKYQKY